MPLRQRHQYAVYWAFSDYDADGDVIVSNPVELKVRWEDRLSQEVTPTTNPIAVTATVWVDREITVGSVLRKGELINLPSTADLIKEVVEYIEIPDVKGRIAERIVLLGKFLNTLPTVA